MSQSACHTRAMLREDWLQRQVKALSELVARVAGVLRGAQPGEALELVRDETARVVGADPAVLAVVDERTVFVLLGEDPARVARYAVLIGLEADVLEATGEGERALRLRVRAESLSAAALQRAEDAARP